MELSENSLRGKIYAMNPITTIRGMLGLVLGFGLAGGGMTLVHNEIDATDQGKPPATVKDLLIDQKPGQITYISFPIAEQFAEHLESSRKFIRFPGERPTSRTLNRQDENS